MRSDYCIVSGTFQKMCGATRDALRYYEQQGVLVPWRNPENGYRYYSYAQMTSYFFIKAFRDIGCSVEQIRAYFLAGRQAQFDAFVDDQYHALLEQRRVLEQRIAILENTRRLLGEVKKCDAGKPVKTRLAADMRVLLTPVRARNARSAADMTEDLPRHLARCETPNFLPFPVGATIALADFLAGDYRYENLFSFVSAPTRGDDILDLSGSAAAAVICRDGDGDIRAFYQALKDFCAREGLRPVGDLYSLSLFNAIDPHEEKRYLKYLFVCVEAAA